MKERKRSLRRAGIGGTIAAFVAAWAIVFGQLVGGHDPALAKQKTTTQAQTQPQSSTSSSSESSESSESSTDSTDSSTPAPVTTSQS